jgi:hypothetical protein
MTYSTRKTYTITTITKGESWNLSFTWQFADGGWGERCVKLTNPNQLVFMRDMLDQLGYFNETA